jgi:hypothetical protein
MQTAGQSHGQPTWQQSHEEVITAAQITCLVLHEVKATM